MTKQQKVDYINVLVLEMRKHFTWPELAAMFKAVWDGLEAAKTAAIDGDPP